MKTKILILIIVALGYAVPATATGYSESKADAQAGKTDIGNSFLAFGADIDSTSNGKTNATSEDYSGLLDEFQTRSTLDPLSKLLELFPVSNRDEITRYSSLDESSINSVVSGTLTEWDIYSILLARSPSLRKAEASWHAMLNRYPQSYYLTDLLTRYMAFTEGMTLGSGKEYQNEMVQMFSPTLGGEGMISLRGKVVELDADIALLDYIRQGRDIIADTGLLLADIKNKDDLINITRESVSRLSVLSSITESQYKSGSATFSDLVRIKTELESRRDRLSRLQSMREGLVGKLATQLNLPSDTVFGPIEIKPPASISLDVNSLTAQLPSSRQELKQMTAGIQKMDAMLGMTRIEEAPDLTMGSSYFQGANVNGFLSTAMGSSNMPADNAGTSTEAGQMGSMEGASTSGPPMGDGANTSQNTMGAAPMDFMQNPMVDHRDTGYLLNTSWALEIADRLESMKAMLAEESNMSYGMLTTMAEEYQRSVKSQSVYNGTVLPDARAAMDAVKGGYISDMNSFNDLIDSELALLNARMQFADLVMDQRMATIDLERLLGFSLVHPVSNSTTGQEG